MIKARAEQIRSAVTHYVMHTVLHADDPPHRLALGIAIGMFVTFTPTIGIQMGLVVMLSWLLGGNKLVGVPLVWISNPVTFVPIYYPCYWLGRMVLGKPSKDVAWWNELRNPPSEAFAATQFYYAKMLEIIAPLTVGCLIVATAVAIVFYYFSLSVIRTYRMKRWGQLIPPQS